MKLQVAALQREVLTLRNSLQAKDTALTKALEDGSAQVQELQVARQELLDRLETAEQQMQVSKHFVVDVCRHLVMLQVSQIAQAI